MTGGRQKQASNSTEGTSAKGAKNSTLSMEQEMESPCTKKDINKLKSLLFCFKDEIQTEIRNSLSEVRTGITVLDQRVLQLEQTQDSVQETTSNMDILIQDLQTQVRDLQDAHEDLENRTRRNNPRLHNIPGTVHLDTFLPKYFRALIPGIEYKYLLLDRAHRALRARPKPNMPPRDVIVCFHYFQTKESILKASRKNQLEIEGIILKLYADLASSTLQKRKDLKPLTEFQNQKDIPYRWGFPFKLTYQHNGLTYTIRHPNDIEDALPYLRDPPLVSPEAEPQERIAQD
ncbi:hypothetical protein XELAEV_18007375mg [Xenopus laevis]|uniref:L1 transposable element RRM domain-containing protein n=1 Tax=Xenopus laevis TaxID=8355 RepID=A0A974I555_XENLA|nr:hypothetical protein XELAEV_18007375mg [Xenopus laevis]